MFSNSLWEYLAALPMATYGRHESFEDFRRRVEWQAYNVDLIQRRPVFTFVTLESEADNEDWNRTEASLLLQSYPHWEWITPESTPRLGSDPRRIPVDKLTLSNLRGDYVCFLRPGEVLSPAALFLLTVELQRNSDPDVWYTNFAEKKGAFTFFSMPEWNWEDFVHLPLLSGAVFTRRSFLQEGDWTNLSEWFFRCQEQGARFRLFPNFLLYRDRPSFFTEASARQQAKAVSGHLERRGLKAEVHTVHTDPNWSVHVLPAIEKASEHKISAILCFRDLADSTILALDFLANQRGEIPLEIVLVDNQSRKEELAKIEQAVKSYPVPVQVMHYDGAFNYARMHNLAVAHLCRGDLILALNNDVFWEGEKNLDELAAWALRDSVGTVGACLSYPNGRIQHAGLQASFGGEARLVRVGNAKAPDRFAHETHSVFGNTFALCMFRRELFEKVGGLREVECANGFGDLVFNFECLKLGLRNLYLGHVKAVHQESASRGDQYQYWEECQVERQYPEILQQMLRYDIGENRLAGSSNPWPAVKEYFSQRLAQRAPWLRTGLKRLAWKLR